MHIDIYVCVYMSVLTLPWLLKLEFVKDFLLKLTMGSSFGSNTNSTVGTDRLLFASMHDTAALPLVCLSGLLLPPELAKVYSLCLAWAVLFCSLMLDQGVVARSSHTYSFPLFQVSDIPLNKLGYQCGMV